MTDETSTPEAKHAPPPPVPDWMQFELNATADEPERLGTVDWLGVFMLLLGVVQLRRIVAGTEYLAFPFLAVQLFPLPLALLVGVPLAVRWRRLTPWRRVARGAVALGCLALVLQWWTPWGIRWSFDRYERGVHRNFTAKTSLDDVQQWAVGILSGPPEQVPTREPFNGLRGVLDKKALPGFVRDTGTFSTVIVCTDRNPAVRYISFETRAWTFIFVGAPDLPPPDWPGADVRQWRPGVYFVYAPK